MLSVYYVTKKKKKRLVASFLSLFREFPIDPAPIYIHRLLPFFHRAMTPGRIGLYMTATTILEGG